MARNTAHILALESMLGIVQDAAFGSYHLENLTHYFCEESWKVMQRMISGEDVSLEITKAKEKKLQMIKTRKKILSGINDYPDAQELLGIELKDSMFFRPSRIFEELRLRMEKIKKPKVFIALFGDYAGLNARLNFVKNYFELVGLEVIDRGSSETDLERFQKDLSIRDEEIIVLCASDEHYPSLKEAVSLMKTRNRFIAGKYEMESCKNLFVGQNIFENLQEIVQEFGGGK
jgi:methylmalonyl-CoA mutase